MPSSHPRSASPAVRAAIPAARPAPPGPAVPEGGPDLGPARRRVLAVVSEAGPEGLTIAALARRLGGHANTVRHHLAALVAEGLVQESAAPPAGRGRPARLFHPAGPHPATGAGAVGYRELAAALVAVAADHPDVVHDAGHRWGEQVAARHPAPAGHTPSTEAVRHGLSAVLDAQGFGTAQDAGGAIELRTCPLVAEAREHPGAVCGVHEAMLQAVLDAWGAPVRAVLEPFALPHACRVLLRQPGG